jgi:hypothetical protein
MRSRVTALGRVVLHATSWGVVAPLVVLSLCISTCVPSYAQTTPYERAFPQSKAAVEKALTALQSSLAGHLPVLDGFANPGDHSLDHYQRGYYQAKVQVSSTPSGGSVVRISTKVTAWYADPTPTRSGYQLLTSNGRLEADLFDQLADKLADQLSNQHADQTAKASDSRNKSAPLSAPKQPASPPPSSATEPAVAAPTPSFPSTDRTFASSLKQGLAAEANSRPSDSPSVDKSTAALQAEATGLEEIVKNMAHPKNLVAIKKSGTPIVSAPSLTAKPQFMASMHDEFEMLDFNADWVHIRVSGLSRGWVWRTSVEMPEGIADKDTHAGASPPPPAAELFHVTREETAQFPGDWEPLRGKSVKIISVEKLEENGSAGGPQEKLEFAKYLLNKSLSELTPKTPSPAGVVLIFDSSDGGMMATTLATLQQWKTGALSDAALWHQTFFDPPEVFNSSPTVPTASAAQ